MFQNITTRMIDGEYTGSSAFWEIAIMITVAFILGWIAKILWNIFFINNKINSILHNHHGDIDKEKEVEEKTVKKTPKKKIAKMVIEKKAVKKITKVKKKVKDFEDDNLKIIEGIGPKIEGLLKRGGIGGWNTLSKTKPDNIREILKSGGDRFAFHDPSTWPEQAILAANDKWEELEEFQEYLSGGKII